MSKSNTRANKAQQAKDHAEKERRRKQRKMEQHAQTAIRNMHEKSRCYADFAVNPESTFHGHTPIYIQGNDEEAMLATMKHYAPACPVGKKHFILFDVRDDLVNVQRLCELGLMIENGHTPLDMNVTNIDSDPVPIRYLAFFYHDGTADDVWMQLARLLRNIECGDPAILPRLNGRDNFALAAMKLGLFSHLPEDFCPELVDAMREALLTGDLHADVGTSLERVGYLPYEDKTGAA